MVSTTIPKRRHAAVSSIMEHLLAHWYAIFQDLNSGFNLIEFLAEVYNDETFPFKKVKATLVELEDNKPQV